MVNFVEFDKSDDEDDFSEFMPTTGRRSTALSFTDDPGTIKLRFFMYSPTAGISRSYHLSPGARKVQIPSEWLLL